MNYIILDLEWNQPLSYQTAAYRKVGDRLIFEMIQIGACKLNCRRRIVDTVSITISPTCYQRIHPRIRRMTGLSSETLAGAPAFREALEQFAEWCGKDYILITWGCDDVSVLKQNMDFFECGDIELPPLYDAQQLFSKLHEQKERIGLKPAMDMLGIEAEENLSFHNARNDAYYTALIFKTFPKARDVIDYPQTPKNLIRTPPSIAEACSGETFQCVNDALCSDTALHPVCPRCGREMTLDGGYIRQTADKYIALGKCRHHGRQLIRLNLRSLNEGGLVMRRTLSPASAQTVAYVHTKRLQVEKQDAEYLEKNGSLPDPDLALAEAERTNMPFDC